MRYGDVYVEQVSPPDDLVLLRLKLLSDAEPDAWHEAVLVENDGRRWRVDGEALAGWRNHADRVRIVGVTPLGHDTIPKEGMRLPIEAMYRKLGCW